MVARDTNNRLDFGTIVQYDAEAVYWLVKFDDVDRHYYNYMEIGIARQLSVENTHNNTTNNNRREY